MSERWRVEPEYPMKIDGSLGLLGVLLEPTTVVTKAWEQVVTVGQRAFWEPRTVLVTGAGPIGLLAALVATQHGLAVHVLDRVESGPKPGLGRVFGKQRVNTTCNQSSIPVVQAKDMTSRQRPASSSSGLQ